MVTRIDIQRSIRGLVLEGKLVLRRFRRHWSSYLLQCGLSAVALLIVLLVMDVVLRTAVSVAIASSAFIVFIMPHSKGGQSPGESSAGIPSQLS